MPFPASFSSKAQAGNPLVAASIAALTLLMLAVPRIGPLVATSIIAVVTGFLVYRDRARSDALPHDWSSWLRPEVPFLAWVFVACLWSVNPSAALAKASMLAALILTAVLFSRHMDLIDQRHMKAISRGIIIGFLIGGTYLAIEILTDDAVARYVLTHFPDLDDGLQKRARLHDGVVAKIFSPSHESRVSAIFCLLWCPAMLATLLGTRGIVRALCFAAIATFSLILLLHPHSASQTAELTLVLTLVVLLLATASAPIARHAAAVFISASLFLVVPASLAMHDANLHTDDDLFRSAQARVIIWNYTAERVLERPIFGVGTNSTRYIDEARPEAEKKAPKDLAAAAATRAHPHNVYLQIWYELGAVGVVTFALLALSMLRSTTLLPRVSSKLAVAHFAACAAVIMPSYGMWQNWFQSAVVFSVLALIVVSKLEPESAEQPS